MLDPQIPVNFKARVEATDAARTTARDVAKQNPAAPWLAEVDDQRRERFEIRHRNGPESVIGDREDFLPVSFLARGYAVSAAVAMVTVGGPQRAGGTGFLIGGGLFITNHHVLPDVDTARASTIEFGYEFDAQGQRLASTRFALDPGTCFITDDQNSLDVTVVAVGPRLDGPGELASFGACTLSDANDKHAIGMALNIIQHPELLPKCIAIRNNLLTARDSQVLLYETDTKVGSSGSPVFNDSWEVVALHHWGEPHLARSVNGEPGLPTNVNEGVRISVIVKHLRSLMPSLPAPAAERLKIALDQPGPPPVQMPRIRHGSATTVEPVPLSEAVADPWSSSSSSSTTNHSASIPICENSMPVTTSACRIVIPLEITIQVGAPAGAPATPLVSARGPVMAGGIAEKLIIDEDFSNRRGYDPHFIDGFEIPLPKAKHRALIAPVSGSGTDQATGELRYEHFSVIMHRTRGMAICTATIIDGDAYLAIDRTTGRPKEEASERWSSDRRLGTPAVEQDFYSAWSTWFDRGHLTRRSDPTWGSAEEAMRANADTFHFTNCTPQHWRFNESAEFWQGVERFILEKGGIPSRKRLCVFQGPVLDDGFAECGSVQVPLRFWKVVVWESAHGLKATGFVVSQERILDQPRRPMKPASDETPIRVDQYRTSISRIGRLTGLDFGTVAAADTRTGAVGAEDMTMLTRFEELL